MAIIDGFLLLLLFGTSAIAIPVIALVLVGWALTPLCWLLIAIWEPFRRYYAKQGKSYDH